MIFKPERGDLRADKPRYRFANRSPSVALKAVAVTAAAVLATVGLAGISAASATGATSLPGAANTTFAIDCADEDMWGDGTSITVAPETVFTITATNCTTEVYVGTGVTVDAALTSYSVAASAEDDLSLTLSDGVEEDAHAFNIGLHRAGFAEVPDGVLTISSVSTIPTTGFTFFDAAIGDDNLTLYEGDQGFPEDATDGLLGGMENCGVEIGKHPYATQQVTIGLDGTYTFRVVATSPISAYLEAQSRDEGPMDDPYLAVYSAFDPAKPGAGVVGCNDDREDDSYVPGVGLVGNLFPNFTADLAPGTYTLVLATYGAWEGESFSESGLDQSAMFQLWGPEGGIEAPDVTPTPTAALDLALGFANGASINNATGTATARGLKEGTTWTLVLHSDPITLGTGVVDGTGVVSAPFTIPANLAPGQHRIILSGVAPDGSVLTSTVWFTLNADGTIGDISRTEPELAPTGAGDVLGGGSLALLALLIGSSVMLIARRRARTL